ncbi:MAG: ATP-binding protein [Pirellulales bacterium]|nr:ATP-binding protein [Pirellulales bacterium]
MEDYEKLGAFYLGKRYDLEHRELRNELILYDSKDLTTHAVCVGMTGSGKTGLCLALLEEAAMDSVPAIIIDPKGDLANLALSFPQLDTASFLPWIDNSEAEQKGMTPEQFAAETAELWKKGLADWGQDAQRIARLRQSVDIPIYTPGSNSGLPLTALRSFEVPSEELIEDADAYREHVTSTVSGLLALLGIDADPVRSREHILISRLLEHAWSEGRDTDVASIIQDIQDPPINRIGVVDVETFYPRKERVDLAMSLNNLLASPSFTGWMEGEPLDINHLLYTSSGKPRLSIISIAHLTESKRMFFVTILLNAVVAWTRSQQGTSSLRALLYMDEVFGYFPPTANPPSKRPMLTLLKQARAFGLGVVLATQNPVDLDYRGLSNIGTWFLGRLQTERDKARVLEGLEGAALQSGTAFDRGTMDKILAALGKRVFLMNNVHDDEPLVFQTRWVMSYLRGPLTRSQIKSLMKDAKSKSSAVDEPEKQAEPALAQPLPEKVASAPTRPNLPSAAKECFLPIAYPPGQECLTTYRAGLLGRIKIHFSKSSCEIDQWETRVFLTPLAEENINSPWDAATAIEDQPEGLHQQPQADIAFAEWPPQMIQSKNYASWEKQLVDFCYSTQVLPLWKCTELKACSYYGESEGDFRARLTQLAREKRDQNVETLRKRYSHKLATLKQRIQTAQERIDREQSEFRKASIDSAASFGSSILAALFGRKLASAANVGRAKSSIKSIGSAAKQRDDVKLAQKKLDGYQKQLADLEEQFAADRDKINKDFRPESIDLESLSLKPLKKDLCTESLRVVWMPWNVDSSGMAEPAYKTNKPG